MSNVSIIIPNYNGEKYLQTCIDSLLNQTYKDSEIIIVENASQDQSLNIIKQYESQVQVIINETNRGFSGAVNDGIEVAEAPYVLLVNNDTEAEPDFVAEMVKAIEKKKKIFSVSALMLRYDNRTIVDDAGDNYNILGWGYKRGDGRPMSEYQHEQSIFSSCGGAAIYRKSILDEIGGFDETFFAYMEDMDLAYRARNKGYNNRYCPTAKIYHIGSATSGSKYNAFKVQLAAQNNVYTIYKNMPWLLMIVNLPFLVIGFAIKYLFFIKKGLVKEYHKGFCHAFKTLNKVKKQPYILKNIWPCIKTELLMIWYVVDYTRLTLIKRFV